MSSASAIFISYRRSHTQDVAGRIYDKLSSHFGHDLIFKDVESIFYGEDFPEKLKQCVSSCKVLIAVIGPTWLEELQGRLQTPDIDWVRTEIAIALQQNIPVIPLLVAGATMPSADYLPDDLRHLAQRNAAWARPDPDFHIDMQRLIQRLEQIVGQPASLDVLNDIAGPSRFQRLELERFQDELANLEQDYKSVDVQLQGEQDGPTRNKLQRQLKQIGLEMDQKEQQINQLRRSNG